MKRKRKISRKALGFIFSLCFSTGVIAQESDTTLTVFFGIDKTNTDSLQVHNVGQFLKAIYEVKEVIGYADSTGSRNYNLKLSQARANYIAKITREEYKYNRPFSVSFKGEQDNNNDLWLNRKVEITASVKDSQHVSVTTDSSTKDGTKIISTITVENVFFLPDKAVISGESLPYVEDLAKFLKSYDKNSFEIVGHVNYQSKLDSSHLKDLYELSRERARVIYDLLIEKGIPKERLRYKGVGNSEPVFRKPKNEIEKRKNMRVVVNILE